MTTLTVPAYNGPLPGRGEQAACLQDAAQVVGTSASNEIPIFADGPLLMVAIFISRLFTSVFVTTVYSADPFVDLSPDPIEDSDYYYSPSCCF